MRRLLILLLAVVALFWWLGRLLARARGGAVGAGTRRASRSMQDGGAMVRDRVCNTFLPRSRALRARVDEEEHFFCSEKCREAFFSRREARSG